MSSSSITGARLVRKISTASEARCRKAASDPVTQRRLAPSGSGSEKPG